MTGDLIDRQSSCFSAVSVGFALFYAPTGIIVSTRLSIMDSTRITASIDTTIFLFIAHSSDLEVISDGDNAADCADKDADRKEGYQHKGPYLNKGHDLYK